MSAMLAGTELVRGVCVATLSGDIDIGSAGTIPRSIVEGAGPGASAVVVDLTDCSYVDSAGIAALFDLHAQLAGRDTPLALVVPKGSPMRRLLDIVQLDDLVPVHDTVASAVDVLGA